MTQEEKESYYAVYTITIDGVTLNGVVTNSITGLDLDMKCAYILNAFKMDLDSIKDKLNEIPEVPDNLDSE